ncbi:MAG TPA: hypothetical protein VK158_04235, partial [Acidobacteriota bacterium]|nr:hypothetical protein [Acidobacteriota bacterium]
MRKVILLLLTICMAALSVSIVFAGTNIKFELNAEGKLSDYQIKFESGTWLYSKAGVYGWQDVSTSSAGSDLRQLSGKNLDDGVKVIKGFAEKGTFQNAGVTDKIQSVDIEVETPAQTMAGPSPIFSAYPYTTTTNAANFDAAAADAIKSYTQIVSPTPSSPNVANKAVITDENIDDWYDPEVQSPEKQLTPDERRNVEIQTGAKYDPLTFKFNMKDPSSDFVAGRQSTGNIQLLSVPQYFKANTASVSPTFTDVEIFKAMAAGATIKDAQGNSFNGVTGKVSDKAGAEIGSYGTNLKFLTVAQATVIPNNGKLVAVGETTVRGVNLPILDGVYSYVGDKSTGIIQLMDTNGNMKTISKEVVSALAAANGKSEAYIIENFNKLGLSSVPTIVDGKMTWSQKEMSVDGKSVLSESTFTKTPESITEVKKTGTGDNVRTATKVTIGTQIITTIKEGKNPPVTDYSFKIPGSQQLYKTQITGDWTQGVSEANQYGILASLALGGITSVDMTQAQNKAAIDELKKGNNAVVQLQGKDLWSTKTPSGTVVAGTFYARSENNGAVLNIPILSAASAPGIATITTTTKLDEAGYTKLLNEVSGQNPNYISLASTAGNGYYIDYSYSDGRTQSVSVTKDGYSNLLTSADRKTMTGADYDATGTKVPNSERQYTLDKEGAVKTVKVDGYEFKVGLFGLSCPPRVDCNTPAAKEAMEKAKKGLSADETRAKQKEANTDLTLFKDLMASQNSLGQAELILNDLSRASRAWSSISPLFYSKAELAEWRNNVDEAFKAFSPAGWIENICAVKLDTAPQPQTSYVKMPDGSVSPAASVQAQCGPAI